MAWHPIKLSAVVMDLSPGESIESSAGSRPHGGYIKPRRFTFYFIGFELDKSEETSLVVCL